MKNGLLILLLAIAAGGGAFWITRTQKQVQHQAVLLDSMPELAWLRGELQLSDAQFSAASALHAAYRPQCVEMCRAIAEAQTRMETMARSAHQLTPELALAIHEHARVKAECQQKMLGHLYQTAALLDEKQSATYLEKVLPQALDSTRNPAVSCHQD